MIARIAFQQGDLVPPLAETEEQREKGSADEQPFRHGHLDRQSAADDAQHEGRGDGHDVDDPGLLAVSYTHLTLPTSDLV